MVLHVMFVCVRARLSVKRKDRPLAGHLIIFATAALRESCWERKFEVLCITSKDVQYCHYPLEEREQLPGLPDMRIFSHSSGNFANMNDISDNRIKMLSGAKMNLILQ